MTNNTTKGVKKSAFTGSSTIPSGSYLDFVVNGQNLRIKDTDFYAALNVTGSIVQEGDPLGTPMLDKQGAVNAIRNITAGFGIKSAINPYNGVTFSTAFSFDETGAALVDNAKASAPTFKSLISENSTVEITETDKTISLSVGASDSNVRVIAKASDFPAAVGGVIELPADIRWDIQGDVTVSFPFVCSGPTSFVGTVSSSKLSYFGSGYLFTSIDAGDLDISGLTMNFPNADMLNMRGDLSPVTSFFRFSNCTCIGGNSFGVYKDLIGVSFFSIVAGLFSPTSKFNSGLTDIGTLTSFLTVAKMGYYSENPTFVGFDFGSNAYDSLEIANTRFTSPVGGVALKGLANSGNVKVGEIASIFSNEVTGGCAPLDTIEEDAFRFSFFEFPPVPNTRASAFISMNGNAVDTVISSTGTPVKVAGNFTENLASIFTTDITGRITYIGERPLVISVDAIIAAGINNGTDDCSIFIAKGNTIAQPVPTVIAGSAQVQELAAGDPRTMVTMWDLSLEEDDFLEIWIQNDDTADDILVSDAKLRAKA